MEILVRGEKLKVTKAIQDYVEDKLSKINKYFGDAERVKAVVVVSAKGYKQKAEVTIPLKTVIIRAEETREDLYAAIDVVVDKLERQIRKNKTKLQSKKMKARIDKDFMFDMIEDIKDEKNDEKIVKRKKIEVKPMDEEEALLQMELLGHQFYIFKDADTNNIAVVYKRTDGNYGIIESE
jgi:putative sigma-54 modulation protein